MKNTTLFAIFIFLLMFFVSGATKVLSLGASESARLAGKLPDGIAKFSQGLVLLAGLFELISSIAVVYGSVYGNKDIAIYGIYGLILFTVLTTLIFYAFPLNYKPALSNLSVITGLYLMMNICFFKN